MILYNDFLREPNDSVRLKAYDTFFNLISKMDSSLENFNLKKEFINALTQANNELTEPRLYKDMVFDKK